MWVILRSFLPSKKLFSFTWNWEARYPRIPLDIICSKDHLIFSHPHAINILLRFSSRRFFKCDTRRTDIRTAVTAFTHWYFRIDLSQAVSSSSSSSPPRSLSYKSTASSPGRTYYLLVSLTSCSSCLHLRPLLPVPVFTSVTCFRRQFLRKLRPIQLAFLLRIVAGYSFPPWIFCITFSYLTWSVQMIPIHLQHHVSKLSVISDLLSEVSNYCIVHVFLSCMCGRSFNSFRP